jgi:ADP-heptose:LPS heptosyltransferase
MPRLPRISVHLAMRWAKRFAKRFPPQPFEALKPDTTARILVVNTTGLGDTIFSTAAIADLRESFPKATIEMFVDRRRLPLVENNPNLDDIVTYPGKYKRVRHTIRLLRARAYDVALIQHANEPDIVPMVAAARPKALVGYEHDAFSLLYSLKVPTPDREAGIHTIDGRLMLTKAIGANGTHWQTKLYPDDGDRAQALELLDDLGLESGVPVALNLGGSLPSKRWPVAQWCALARVLTKKGHPCIFVGGSREQLLAEIVREHLVEENIYFAVGALPFMAATALLTHCAVLVSGDTGLMHAGLALGVPTVALFGPDDPRWTGPHPNHKNAVVVQVPREDIPEDYDRRFDRTGELMKKISVESVVVAINSLLPESSGS